MDQLNLEKFKYNLNIDLNSLDVSSLIDAILEE